MGFFVEPLVERGLRVIALDGPAHGRTPGKQAGPYHFAQALRGVQTLVGPFRAAIGHSMGGAAITLAVGDGLTVGRIVMLGAPSDFADVRDRYMHWMGAGPRTRAAFHREMMRRLNLTDDAPSLKQIAVGRTTPVLVVHDPEDHEVPVVDGRANATAWTNARLLEPDAGGHRKMLKHPAVVAAVTEFLLEK
jgi:pimeloyl-ACP methyl ester carboxylesterase